MVIINITSQVDASTETMWMEWMLEKYIPKAVALGNFTGIDVLKLRQNESDPTYAIQHKANSVGDLNDFKKSYPAFYQKWVREEFLDKVLSFETELELISQHV